jgi:hypothetical protein
MAVSPVAVVSPMCDEDDRRRGTPPMARLLFGFFLSTRSAVLSEREKKTRFFSPSKTNRLENENGGARR